MVTRKFDCTVIGDVVLDIFFGNKGRTIAFQLGGTSYCDFAKIDFGGAGNVAAALSLLDAKASFVGKAGNDPWGRMYEENLKGNGVTTNMFFENKIPTSLALIGLQEKGERSFHVFRGANDRLSTKEIDRSLGLIKESQYLYFCGYSLVANPQRDAILHALALARNNGVKVFFDPGAYNLVNSNFELFNEIVHSCDVFCPNLDEAKAIFRTHYLKKVIRELRNTAKFAALKCGARGCILFNEGECVKVPGFKTDRLDTTGAGDAFAAALIYGLVNHFPLISVGQIANWFAAQVTNGIGARSYPNKTRLRNFLAQVRKQMDTTCAEL